ncbi:hypothetical protein HEP87_61715 [Streptomyces sp. S1D4-11]|nr:hypothetical protein [Streptomyces sp. S1D4-11]
MTFRVRPPPTSHGVWGEAALGPEFERLRTGGASVYGAAPGSLSVGADLARKLASVHGAAKARVVWFLGPDQPEAYVQGSGTRVQLKDFNDGPGQAPGVPVQEDKQIPEEAGFGAFAE